MEFTVKRSSWLRGMKDPNKNEIKSSKLQDSNGNRCCLGFLAVSCDIPEEAIKEKDFLINIDCEWQGKLSQDLLLAEKAIARLNDDRNTSEIDKETNLTKRFANLGITVRFED